MNYRLRQGIVFTKICGQYLLIPNRKASETCPHIKPLSIISAAMIENIQKGYPMEKIYQIYEVLSRKTKEESCKRIDQLAEELCKHGFLEKVAGDINETK